MVCGLLSALPVGQRYCRRVPWQHDRRHPTSHAPDTYSQPTSSPRHTHNDALLVQSASHLQAPIAAIRDSLLCWTRDSDTAPSEAPSARCVCQVGRVLSTDSAKWQCRIRAYLCQMRVRLGQKVGVVLLHKPNHVVVMLDLLVHVDGEITIGYGAGLKYDAAAGIAKAAKGSVASERCFLQQTPTYGSSTVIYSCSASLYLCCVSRCSALPMYMSATSSFCM